MNRIHITIVFRLRSNGENKMYTLEQQQVNAVSGGSKTLTFENAIWDLNGYVGGAALGLFLHYNTTGLPFWTPYPGPTVYAMIGGTVGAFVADSLYNKI